MVERGVRELVLLRLDPGPLDAEAECIEAEPGHQGDVLSIPVVEVASVARRLHARRPRAVLPFPPVAERLILHFGAVDYGATVWVNGSEVARHEGGHTPFSADITAAVRPRDNEIVVRADDPATDLTIPRGKQFWRERSEGIFYTPTTGIWQTVWLEPLPP